MSVLPSYLPYYLARQLHTTVRCYEGGVPEGGLILQQPKDFEDAVIGPALARRLLSEGGREAKGVPARILSVEGILFYGFVEVGEDLYLAGPVKIPQQNGCRENYRLSELACGWDDKAFADWAVRAGESTADFFMDSLMLLVNGNSEAGETSFSEQRRELLQEFIPRGIDDETQAACSRLIFQQMENSFVHNPYSHEYRENLAVEQGDLESLKLIMQEDFTGRYGRLADSPLRQEIDLGIILITLVSRAAIRGGLSYETAFSLSDSYIHAMEDCTDPMTARHISREGELHYARLVAELHRAKKGSPETQENLHISHCKDYVYSHLHGKLTVQDIAAAIGLEPNYLSALFKRCEKITLKEYILNAKIDLVKNMLRYSDYSYIEIASYLGFSSQSHMGENFKKLTGMTPKTYRNTYRPDDFLNEYR